MIKHVGRKWVLYTKDGKKLIAKRDTKEEVLAIERAIWARRGAAGKKRNSQDEDLRKFERAVQGDPTDDNILRLLDHRTRAGLPPTRRGERFCVFCKWVWYDTQHRLESCPMCGKRAPSMKRRNSQDEELRRLERAWRESGSGLDRERYVAALIRARQHETAFAVDPTNVEATREGFRAWFAENLNLDEALRWWFTHAVAVVPRWSETHPNPAKKAIETLMNACFEALRGRYVVPSDARTMADRENGERVGEIPAAEIPNTWPERIHRDPEHAADEIVFTRLAAMAETLERAAGAPDYRWPQWIELEYDTHGLWYSPGGPEFLRYNDLDDAAGDPGILVEAGGASFGLSDLLHGPEDQTDPILQLAALEATQFEEARRSRWAEWVVANAAHDVLSHRGFDSEALVLVISEEDIERLDRQGKAIPHTRYQMREEPKEPLTETQREEYLVRAGAYAIGWGVPDANGVRVAWRTWAKHEDEEGVWWEVESEGDTNTLLVQVLRERGVDA